MFSFNHGRVEDRILIVMKGACLSAIFIKVLLKGIQASFIMREVSMFFQEAECSLRRILIKASTSHSIYFSSGNSRSSDDVNKSVIINRTVQKARSNNSVSVGCKCHVN